MHTLNLVTKSILILAVFSSAVATGQAKLASATISFVTPINTDGKDWNTNLTISLYLSDGTLVATAPYSRCDDGSSDVDLLQCFCCAHPIYTNGQITNPKTMFIDNGTERGPFNVTVSNQVNKQDITTGYFVVQMKPTGNDRWIFIPKLTLKFNDNSVVVYTKYSNTIIAQDAQTATLVFNKTKL